MRKYCITLMLDNDTSLNFNVECDMSIYAQMMALGLLDNSENARWVKVEDDNGKMLVIYFKK